MLGELLNLMRSSHLISEITLDSAGEQVWQRAASREWVAMYLADPLCSLSGDCVQRIPLDELNVSPSLPPEPVILDLLSPQEVSP